MKKGYLILSLIILVIVIVFVFEKLAFPISYKICGFGYEDCHVVAKFRDRGSCEETKKFWNWLCDQTDPNNIKCRPELDTSNSSAYCE